MGSEQLTGAWTKGPGSVPRTASEPPSFTLGAGERGEDNSHAPPQMAAKIPKPIHSAPEMCVLLNARVRTGRLRLMFMKNTRKIGCGGQGAIKLGYLLEGGGP